jgi:hypothetical protein
MKDLAEKAIDKVKDDNDENIKERKKLQERFKAILKTNTIRKDRKDEVRNYKDLIRGRFKLTKVLRIEHTNYINSISGKGGDLTFQTINKLIKEGEIDTWLTLIQDDIDHMILSPDVSISIQDTLTNKLKQIEKILKDSDYQNTIDACSELTEFIDELAKNKQVIDKLRSGQCDKLRKSAEDFEASLEQT